MRLDDWNEFEDWDKALEAYEAQKRKLRAAARQPQGDAAGGGAKKVVRRVVKKTVVMKKRLVTTRSGDPTNSPHSSGRAEEGIVRAASLSGAPASGGSGRAAAAASPSVSGASRRPRSRSGASAVGAGRLRSGDDRSTLGGALSSPKSLRKPSGSAEAGASSASADEPASLAALLDSQSVQRGSASGDEKSGSLLGRLLKPALSKRAAAAAAAAASPEPPAASPSPPEEKAADGGGDDGLEAHPLKPVPKKPLPPPPPPARSAGTAAALSASLHPIGENRRVVAGPPVHSSSSRLASSSSRRATGPAPLVLPDASAAGGGNSDSRRPASSLSTRPSKKGSDLLPSPSLRHPASSPSFALAAGSGTSSRPTSPNLRADSSTKRRSSGGPEERERGADDDGGDRALVSRLPSRPKSLSEALNVSRVGGSAARSVSARRESSDGDAALSPRPPATTLSGGSSLSGFARSASRTATAAAGASESASRTGPRRTASASSRKALSAVSAGSSFRSQLSAGGESEAADSDVFSVATSRGWGPVMSLRAQVSGSGPALGAASSGGRGLRARRIDEDGGAGDDEGAADAAGWAAAGKGGGRRATSAAAAGRAAAKRARAADRLRVPAIDRECERVDADARRLAGLRWVALSLILLAWVVLCWFVLVYGGLVFRLLGDRAQAAFLRDWGIGLAMDTVLQWRSVVLEAIQVRFRSSLSGAPPRTLFAGLRRLLWVQPFCPSLQLHMRMMLPHHRCAPPCMRRSTCCSHAGGRRSRRPGPPRRHWRGAVAGDAPRRALGAKHAVPRARALDVEGAVALHEVHQPGGDVVEGSGRRKVLPS